MQNDSDEQETELTAKLSGKTVKADHELPFQEAYSVP